MYTYRFFFDDEFSDSACSDLLWSAVYHKLYRSAFPGIVEVEIIDEEGNVVCEFGNDVVRSWTGSLDAARVCDPEYKETDLSCLSSNVARCVLGEKW